MKKQKNVRFLVCVLSFFSLLSLTGQSNELPAKETSQGNYSYLNPFAHKPASAEEHMKYANALLESGEVGAARKQFEIFVKRWPEDEGAAVAQKAVGDLFYQQGKHKKAFEAYELLIQKYYSGIRAYDSVLENQLAIADFETKRKRMSWVFGGYTAPERAIPYLESIVRNAPQWDRTPEMQYRIGRAYQKNDNYEMAIVAYTTVEYRYPDSAVAEVALFEKVLCLRELVLSTPYSLDLREQAEQAVRLFKAVYPESEHAFEVETFGKTLYDSAARAVYETGEFYERVPLPPRTDSARIYYEKVIELYGGTEYALLAAKRLKVLVPGTISGSGALVNPKIFPVPEETLDVDGSELPAKPIEAWPLPERLNDDRDAIEVTADRMEYQGDLLIAEGHVALQQDGASMRADYVTVNHETGEVAARGDILMLRDDNLWEGQQLVYNYKTKVGSFGESDMYFEPVHVNSEEIERVSSNEYVMYNAQITTCSGDKPIIYARAKEVRVFDQPHEDGGCFIKAKHVTFYVKGIPVLYTPRWQRHLGYRIFSFSVGVGGNLGAFVMGQAKLHPTDWLATTTRFDYYSRRGVGLGQNFDWKTKNGTGSFKAYHINDSSPFEQVETVAEEALVDSSRYRVKLDHREQISADAYFITKVNYLSDRFVLEDFFDDEFRNNANPENYAVIQQATDEYAASLRTDKRLNDFYTTVDRLPELDFNWYRSRVAESPLYFQSDNGVAYMGMSFAKTNLPPVLRPDDYHSVRADTYNQMFLPMRIRDFFNVIPRAAYRGTWYSDTPSGESPYRQIAELGTWTSVKAYKTLSEKSGFYGEGLRHIFEPYADFLYRYSSIEPGMLHQFDDVDTLDDENRVRFGLLNYLQSKRGANRIANVLDADVFTTYNFEPAVGEEHFGPIEADIELRLTEKFSVMTDFEYDGYQGRFNDFNTRAQYTTDDRSEFALSHRFLEGERSLYTPSISLFPNDDWSYEFFAQYDASLGEWRERKLLVNHKFDCLGMGLGLNVDEDDEPMLWVQLWLTAFPDAIPQLQQ